jgi:Spy/CpxP family protein refolding chaperone
MRSNQVLKFALIASLVLNVTLLATAGYHAYRRSAVWVSPFGQEMHRNQFLFEELSLGPEQLRSLKERTIPFRAEIDRSRKRILVKRKELIDLMRSEKPDSKAIEVLISDISGLQEQVQQRITKHMLEVKASLDKDNQQKFLDLIEKRIGGAGNSGCPPDNHDR